MSNIITQSAVEIQLKEAVRSKMELSIQGYADLRKDIVLNEDNLQKMKDFVEKGEKMLKVLETEKKKGKEDILKETTNWDNGFKAVTKLVKDEITPVFNKLQSISRDIENRRIAAAAKKAKEDSFNNLINEDIEIYTHAINSAKDRHSLIVTEKKLNLLIVNKGRYGEFVDTATEKLNTLLPLIDAQKQIFKSKEDIEIAGLSDEELESRQDKLDNLLEEQRTITANTSFKTASSFPLSSHTYAEESFPDISLKRRQWKIDANIKDFEKLIKKHPEWIKSIELNDEPKKFMKQNKDSWDKENKEEHIESGVRFYLDKTYK